ncbi:hypothetical protein ACHAQJ_000655 [Trichoderma viride]
MQTKLREHWQRFAHASEHMDSQSERRPSSVLLRRKRRVLVPIKLQAVGQWSLRDYRIVRLISEKDAVIDKAYFMCYGQPGALIPTHTVITATLAVPLFGTGPITFPPVTKTKTSGQTTIPTAISRETQSSISLPTTLVTDPTSLPSPKPSMTRSTTKPTNKVTTRSATRPSTTSFESSTSSPAAILTTDPVGLTFTETTTASTETSTSTNVPDGIVGGPGEKKASATLTTGQVAGIAIGCITGAGFIGIGIAVFCRCLRKRRSKFGRKMRKDGRPLRDSWGGNGTEKGPRGGGGTDSWIANQLRAPLDPGPVPAPTKSWYNRASWRPSAIGLAISPARTRDVTRATTPTSARPLSKLLPAKPVMGQGPPRLEVSLPSRDGDSHFGAATFMGAAAAGAASGAIMSGAIAASSSSKPAIRTMARPMAQPVTREPVKTGPFIQPRSLTPPRSKPQSPLALKLVIPKTGNFKPFVPVIARHDSSTTEFEEDGRTSLSPGGQIWRPPSADPLTAAPYYVADRSGNWRLGDPARAQEIAELEASISPLTAAPKSAAPKLVAGLGLATGAAGALALVKAASQREANRAAEAFRAAEKSRQGGLGIMIAPEKTIRAVEPSLSSDEEIQEQDQQPYAPRPLFSVNGNGNGNNLPRRSSTHRRSSTRSLTRPRITSTDSGVTTFSTSTDDDTDLRSPPPMEQLGNLSPVVESPRSFRPGRGRSPTQYPKIPASLNAAMPSSGNFYSDIAGAKASKPAVTADGPAQQSPSFGAPLAAGTMSSYSNMPKQQGKKLLGSDAVRVPNTAARTGSPMMRVQGSTSRPDQGSYSQGPRIQAPQQANPSTQPNAASSLRPQQNQQYPAPAYQKPPSNNNNNNNPMPYRLPPHPTAYRPNIDSSGYPYQTRLPDFNQGPAPNPNRYPHHNPRNQQPPFTQQQSSGRPISQQPSQRPQQQPQQRQQPQLQRQQRPPSLGPMPQQQQPQQQQQQQQQWQQQNLYFQPSASSYYPSSIPPGPLLTSTSTSTSNTASTDSSQSSSLLAKRLGTSRAANMATIQVPQPTTTSSSSSKNKWLRQGQGHGSEPSTPKMPPPPQQPTELPATPVWKPRLTPTRRGDDLFLIAQ